MAGAPTPEARLQAFSESFRARMEAAEEPPTGESCQALSFIIVSDPVWLELHARFDRVEPPAFRFGIKMLVYGSNKQRH
jgi:hypothetical protein